MSTDPDAETATPRPWRWGSAVENGRVRFLSVSAIAMATPEESGCLRKWGHRYLDGHRPPDSKYTARGKKGHAEVYSYLATGVNALGRMALKGMHFIPHPAVIGPDGVPDLLLEHEISGADPYIVDEIDLIDDLLGHEQPHNPIADAQRDRATARRAQLVEQVLAAAPLRAAGIPVLGQLDLSHARGENKGTEDVSQAWDPPGTREVCDWKFVSDERFLKLPSDLPKLVQMSGYGAWVYRVYPNTILTRLSHGYFVDKGRSQKRTIRVDREVIERGWAKAESTARAIQHAAGMKTANEIEANVKACDAFGGCPHREYCSAGKFNSLTNNLAAVIGQTAAEEALGVSEPLVQIRERPHRTEVQAAAFSVTPPGESHMMSMLDHIKARQAQLAAAPAAQPAPQAGAIQTQVATTTPSLVQQPAVTMPVAPLPQAQITIQPEVARLQAEEAALRQQYGQQPAPIAQPQAGAIQTQAQPMPLAQQPAIVQAASPAQVPPWPPGFPEAIAEIEASGKGFPHTRGEAARCYGMLKNYPPAQGYGGSGEIGAAGVTIESAHQVFQLVQELRAMVAQAATQLPPPPTQQQIEQARPPIQNVLPPDAPASAPPVNTQASAIAATTALADQPKKKRTRGPNKPKDAQVQQGGGPDQQQDESTELQVFIDCVPNCETADFRELLSYMHGELLKRFPCEPADIRCAGKDSPLAYGGADGAIQAFTKDIFAKGLAPLVAYRLETGGDRLALAAASALAEVCAAQGALYVRGGGR